MAVPLRPTIRFVQGFDVGRPLADVQRELGLPVLHRMLANENPLGASPLAIQAIRDLAPDAGLYPDGPARPLRARLAERLSIGEDSIFFGAGSDECLRILGHALLEPDSEVLVGDPSFVCYDETASLAGCRLVKVPLDSNLKHDLPAMARAAGERTRIIFLANPNNPTGTVVETADLDRFLDDLPPTALVVLDEAYCDYARENPDYPDGIAYVSAGRNVCVLRTFSKAYGLSGLRIGYGVAAPELADACNRIRQPFNVSSAAQVAALAALDDGDHIARSVEYAREARRRLSEAMARHGGACAESWANFVFAEFPFPTDDLAKFLLRRGVVVRPGRGFGRPNGLRVSIGTPEAMDAFEAAMEAAALEAQTR